MWPEGAPSKKSVRAVKKLARLRNIIATQGDASALPYVDLLCDLLLQLLRSAMHGRRGSAKPSG